MAARATTPSTLPPFAQANGLIINLGEGTSGQAFWGYTAGGVTTFTLEDTLISFENVIGTNHKDLINGNSQANVLEGRGGDDFIFGAGGGDTLIGGSGADTFTYTSTSDSLLATGQKDRILDFERGIDKIDLSAIDANMNLSGDQAFVIVNGFTGQAGQLMAISEWHGTGQGWQGDTNGDGQADFAIFLDTTDGLSRFLGSTDFIV
jgi:Ca2+-binding RTX toxin-like protein